MKQSDRSPLGLYTIGIAGLFLAGFFLLVLFGAQTYRNVVRSQNGNYQARSLLAYLSTCVKSGDTGGVRVRQGETGPVLVVPDGDSGYALRIYQSDGKLLEDYAPLDAELRPDSAQIIGQTQTFSAEEQSGLLLVTTDAGRVLLYLRSEGSGEAP